MTRRSLLLLLFAYCVLVSFSGSVSAQHIYQVTESELTQLEQIFNQLSGNNQTLLTDFEESSQDLTTDRQKLVSYQQELATLQKQLLMLKSESTKVRSELEQANSLLIRAGESWRKYEREARSDIKSLTWQRNGLIALACILALK